MEGNLFDKEGHLFYWKGHLFLEGSQFCNKLLGGRYFDHVYGPLGRIFLVIFGTQTHARPPISVVSDK